MTVSKFGAELRIQSPVSAKFSYTSMLVIWNVAELSTPIMDVKLEFVRY